MHRRNKYELQKKKHHPIIERRQCFDLIHDVIEYYEDLGVKDLPKNVDIYTFLASTYYWKGLFDGSNYQ